MVTIAQHLPLVTLCSLAMAEDCSDAGSAAGMVKREVPYVGEVEATATLEEGASSLSTIDPPLIGAIASGANEMALVVHREEVGPNKCSFAWPHPIDPHKALFVLNDTAEQAAWASAS